MLYQLSYASDDFKYTSVLFKLSSHTADSATDKIDLELENSELEVREILDRDCGLRFVQDITPSIGFKPTGPLTTEPEAPELEAAESDISESE